GRADRRRADPPADRLDTARARQRHLGVDRGRLLPGGRLGRHRALGRGGPGARARGGARWEPYGALIAARARPARLAEGPPEALFSERGAAGTTPPPPPPSAPRRRSARRSARPGASGRSRTAATGGRRRRRARARTAPARATGSGTCRRSRGRRTPSRARA